MAQCVSCSKAGWIVQAGQRMLSAFTSLQTLSTSDLKRSTVLPTCGERCGMCTCKHALRCTFKYSRLNLVGVKKFILIWEHMHLEWTWTIACTDDVVGRIGCVECGDQSQLTYKINLVMCMDYSKTTTSNRFLDLGIWYVDICRTCRLQTRWCPAPTRNSVMRYPTSESTQHDTKALSCKDVY